MVQAYRKVLKGKSDGAHDVIVKIYGAGLGEKDKIGETSYPRYWHGYLIVLKPLLAFFSFDQIVIINRVLVFLLILVGLGALFISNHRVLILPFAIVEVFLNPLAIGTSIQYMSVFTIAHLSLLALILFPKKLGLVEKPLNTRMVMFFIVVGGLTSYFDLLTYPLLSFGLPSVYCIALFSFSPFILERYSPAAIFTAVLVYLASWGVGYVGIWAGKWVLAWILRYPDVITDALSRVKYRSSTLNVETSATLSYFGILNRQLAYLGKYALSFVAAYVFYFCYPIVNNLKVSLRFLPRYWYSFLFLFLLPLIWDFSITNHSFLHPWLTHRMWAISIFSMLCFVVLWSRSLPTRSEWMSQAE